MLDLVSDRLANKELYIMWVAAVNSITRVLNTPGGAYNAKL